jgi:putative membrane protein
MMPGNPMMGGPGGLMTWMFFSSLIYSVIWLVLAGVAVWALVRWVTSRTAGSAGRDLGMPAAGPSAEEILRQRYARGEIDASTFAEMRSNLEAPGAEAHPVNGNARVTPATTTR